METEIILDNEYATLYYYPEHKIVHHKFHKFIYGEHFREVLQVGIELFEKHGCTKWLSNDRNNSILNREDSLWAEENWAGHALASGWQYWALLMPNHELGQQSMQRDIEGVIELGLNVQTFTETEQALEWLKNQN